MATLGNMIWIVVVSATATASAACTLASPTYISSSESADTDDSGAPPTGSSASAAKASGDGGALTCSESDYTKADLSKLTACGDGHGHCYAKDKVALASMLVACADASMVCVPDEILEANGQPLKSCTSIAGAGGCVTATLIPEIIAEGGSALKPDVCDPTQLCVPCKDPRAGGAPTPFCIPTGVHTNACAAAAGGAGTDGGTTAPSATPCCTSKGHSNGVCITEAAIPADQRDDAPQDACPNGNKCAPASFVSGKPVKCKGGILGSGVCMDKCFNEMMGIAGSIGLLSTDGCGDTEVCVSCDLISGKGVPGCP